MTNNWLLRPADPDRVRRVARDQGVPDVVARILVSRGQEDSEAAGRYLEASLHSLHNPFLLPGMRTATKRLQRAVNDGERILIHGDYDVDGVMGTALLIRLLRLLGAEASWHIPDRKTDGYSFGEHSLRAVAEMGAHVVVSVDNGTSAHEVLWELKGRGVDVIVTDHHEPPAGPLPAALAVVNPKVHHSKYPFRELCGAGVAFKLAWGLCQEIAGPRKVRDDLRAFLLEATAYVGMATLCDVVPLVDENRVLGRRGLIALQHAQSPGLRALLDVCGLTGRELVGEDVGFKIGPRLNAAGRIDSAHRAVELLLCEDEAAAREGALALDELNVQRKRIEAELLEQALRAAEPFADRERYPMMVVAGQGWHQGVIGIVAARLTERFARPAVVIGLDGEAGRGSVRSVPGFSVLACMDSAASLMIRHGGHAQAAGMDVRADAVDDLREALCEKAREMLGGGDHPASPLLVDYDLPLGHVTPELMRQLDRLEPFGECNEKPVLVSSGLRLAQPPRAVGADATHLMLQVRSGETVFRAMAFGMAHRAPELHMGEPLHVAYTPRWNTFRGETNLELVVVDFQTGTQPALDA